jgi:uncharacterized cupin superfamily protein
VGNALQDLGLDDLESTQEYLSNEHRLSPAPISAGWVLEGNPAARGRLLSSSTDGMASTYMWDCTAGRFNWFYHVDETICIVEGSVILVDSSGSRQLLKPGDTFFFPRGSRFEWTVASYVRKIAFLHVPLSPKVLYLKRVFKAVKRMLRPGSADAGTPKL